MLGEVGKFIYSLDSSTRDELSSCMQNARMAVTDLRYLWPPRDTQLSIKRLMYITAVRSVLSYKSHMRSLRKIYTERLPELKHRRLRFTARI